MFREEDPRDINIKDPEAYFAYTAPNTSRKTTEYILKKDLLRIKDCRLPQKSDYSTGGSAPYYSNTNGRYAGNACAAHFLSAKEIQDYLVSDEDFVKKAVDENVTWFFPENIRDIFIF